LSRCVPVSNLKPLAGRTKPAENEVNIDPIKFLTAAKKIPPYVLLGGIALAIVWVISKHQNVVIVLPLVGILAVIVLSLVIGSLRRR
jgi:hypothetical protein